MRLLFNLPLAFAAFSAALVIRAAVLGELPRGSSEQLSAGLLILVGTVVYWAIMIIMLVNLAARGEMSFLPAKGAGPAMISFIAMAALVALWLLPGIVTTFAHFEDDTWGSAQVLPARFVAVGMPLALLAYAAWIINAPAELRDLTAARHVMLGTLMIFCLVAGVVLFQELARRDAVALAQTELELREEDARKQSMREAFATLTDADSLDRWDQFTGYYNTPDDVREAALLRIAQRRDRDAALAEMLARENTNYTVEALSLIARAPFTPGPALDRPVRDAFAVLIGILRHWSARQEPFEYYGDKFYRTMLAAARHMAEGGIDLRPSLTEIEALATRFPRSQGASDLAAETAAARRDITAILGPAGHS